MVMKIGRRVAMEMTLADAKARFSEVVDRAVAGAPGRQLRSHWDS